MGICHHLFHSMSDSEAHIVYVSPAAHLVRSRRWPLCSTFAHLKLTATSSMGKHNLVKPTFGFPSLATLASSAPSLDPRTIELACHGDSWTVDLDGEPL
jgi:hypothetical protein